MKSIRLSGFLLTTVLAVNVSHAITTEIMVLESIPSKNAVVEKGQILTLKDGTIYHDQKPLSLPPKQKARVLFCDGKTILLEGEKFTLPDLSEKAKSECPLAQLAQNTEECNPISTDTMPDCEKRGDSSSRPTVWMVDVSTSATICVKKRVRLWRSPEQRQAAKLVLTHQTTSESITVNWRAKRAMLEWPSQMPIDGKYTVKLGDNEAKTITLRQLPVKLETNAMKMLWMIENGCPTQARRLFEIGNWDD